MPFLAVCLCQNHAAVSNFSNSWMTEVLAKRSMAEIAPGAASLIAAGVNVGVALSVRQQLHKALRQTL
eukprot:SAG22_NODE_10784_length_516_cov_0.961631_2_plen_67_part_01